MVTLSQGPGDPKQTWSEFEIHFNTSNVTVSEWIAWPGMSQLLVAMSIQFAWFQQNIDCEEQLGTVRV